jgi:hypothetical protein
MVSTYACVTHAAMLESGISDSRCSVEPCTTYESNVLYALRFMVDKGIVSRNPFLCNCDWQYCRRICKHVQNKRVLVTGCLRQLACISCMHPHVCRVQHLVRHWLVHSGGRLLDHGAQRQLLAGCQARHVLPD